MDSHVNLNLASPIVQRVLRLREHRALDRVVPLSRENASDRIPLRKSSQWQMWQKSDFFAYVEDEPGYRCKE